MSNDRERPIRLENLRAADRAPRAAASLIVVLGLVAALGLAAPALTQAVGEPPEAAAADDAAVDAAASAAAAAEAPPNLVPSPAAEASQVAAPKDPWRRFNRGSYAFNGVLDRALIGPVARAYRRVTPGPVRRGLGRMVDNLREPSTVVNEVLQGHPGRAVRASARFVTNSTVGVLGMFDVAGKAGLERRRADFGQTLGRYGVGPGPYLYLPVIGPLNVRDGLGQVVDALTDPVSLATGGLDSDFGAGRLGVTALDTRAGAEATLTAIAEQATDPYATIRSAYGQSREAVVREATGAAETLPDFDDSPAAPDPPTAAGIALAANAVSEPIY
ncbi:VacJ family lipoprotein [Phenylobacterium sp.]|uniref:MlaA family lipoprotein n=1 Tax=Phenylobacterium sp. TaxID=1871053 RepID=UPI0027257DBF|nr:VacJ family lipoprotein [Phenylobacterium sp.]MDO8380374.1 VacJ family lipoprotein [Phenylobacterium sp.]